MMKPREKQQKKEFGDFQTPPALSKLMVNILKNMEVIPNKIIEPTCGLGSILLEAHNKFNPEKTIGIEINNDYYNFLCEKTNANQFISILNNDIFNSFDTIKSEIRDRDLCLFIGNPPWVTNSELSSLNSKNLPVKSNIKNLRGIEAITGKSNFDISEYIILKLIEVFNNNKSVYAFLCKTSVARNILKYCWNNHIGYNNAYIFPIDSKKYFNAAVDACYFIFDVSRNSKKNECIIFDSIETQNYKNKIGIYNGKLISNIDIFLKNNYLGKSEYIWRNGIKHDCSNIMEFYVIDLPYAKVVKTVRME